jgi:hypothetical protein
VITRETGYILPSDCLPQASNKAALQGKKTVHPEPKSTVAEASEAVKGTAHRIGAAIDKGRKPGMPLSILSNIGREAPLASLLVAFLLGVAVARRR